MLFNILKSIYGIAIYLIFKGRLSTELLISRQWLLMFSLSTLVFAGIEGDSSKSVVLNK